MTLSDGKQLSRGDRSAMQLDSISLTYGEIEFVPYYSILRRACLEYWASTELPIYYDLGSGTGRAVFASHLSQDFASCEGIEILSGLFESSLEIQKLYNSSFQGIIRWNVSPAVRLHCNSILDHDWSNGDIVFANSTCFDSSLMEKLSKKAEELKPGSVFISFTKSLSSDKFTVVDKCKYTMSWGPATVFVHRRLRDDGTDLALTQPAPSLANRSARFEKYRARPTADVTPSTGPAPSLSDTLSQEENVLPSVLDFASATPSTLRPGKHVEFKFDIPADTSSSSSSSSSKRVKSLKFLLWAPPSFSAANYVNLPLVVFLHGASARGGDFAPLKGIALPHMLDDASSTAATHVGALVLSPLCPGGTEWRTPAMCNALMALVDEVAARCSVDRGRIYLTGVSMGGLGAWMLAARNCERFAALSPMCGGGNVVYARLVKHIPMYVTSAPTINHQLPTARWPLLTTAAAISLLDLFSMSCPSSLPLHFLPPQVVLSLRG